MTQVCGFLIVLFLLDCTKMSLSKYNDLRYREIDLNSLTTSLTSNNVFSYKLENAINGVRAFRLGNLQLPLTYYNFQDYSLAVTGLVTNTIPIADGNYTAAELDSLLTANTSIDSATFNSNTGKLELVFVTTVASLTASFSTPFDPLGLSPNTINVTTVTGDSVFQLDGPEFLYLRSNLGRDNTVRSIIDQTEPNANDILCKIPTAETFGSSISYEPKIESVPYFEYKNPQNIKEVDLFFSFATTTTALNLNGGLWGAKIQLFTEPNF